MSDKDLVSRRRVLARKKTMYGWSSGEEVVVSVEYIESIPPVKQPMSAEEYLKERTRMEAWSAENCYQASFDCDDWCCECLYDQVPSCVDEAKQPLEAIAIVEKWAKEHPERGEESQEAAGNADADA